MASVQIITNYFRLSYPHLATRHSVKGGTPKFEITHLFPQSGFLPAELGGHPANCDNIRQALETVCQQEWQCSYADAPLARGIQNFPRIKDGNSDPSLRLKDDNGNYTNQFRPETVAQFVIASRSIDEVGLSDAQGSVNITPDKFYSGCYCRAQLEVSAYDGASGSVISITLLNLQKCYDGESLGGKVARQSADQVFGAIADTNIAAGSDQSLTPVPPAQAQTAATPPPHPQAGQQQPQTAPVLEPHENTPDYLNPPPQAQAGITPPPPAADAPPTPPTPPAEKSYKLADGSVHLESALRANGYTDAHFSNPAIATLVA
jgi:hypothetical protein